MKSVSFPILSFFTGAGFLDLGFLQNKFNIVWHNEHHKPFVYGFESAMAGLGYKGASAVIQNANSIVDLGPNEIISEAFPNIKLPKQFGIIGGPPCPDFSVGGKNLGQMGNRGKLSEVYVNRIAELNPAFFLFENVPGILRTKKHREFLASLLYKLSGQFAIDINILNALDFGVPQDRERVFIIGFRRSWLRKHALNCELRRIGRTSNFVAMLTKLPLKKFFATIEHWFPWPNEIRFADAKHRFNWPHGAVPKGVFPQKPNLPQELMAGTYICDESRYELPNSNEYLKPKSEKFNQVLEGDVSRKSFKRLHRFRYSPTVAYGNNEVHLHPVLRRRLTVREALMLQSVPNQYVLPADMSLTDKFKTIGNGVPVKLSKAMAGAISKYINGVSNEDI